MFITHVAKWPHSARTQKYSRLIQSRFQPGSSSMRRVSTPVNLCSRRVKTTRSLLPASSTIAIRQLKITHSGCNASPLHSLPKSCHCTIFLVLWVIGTSSPPPPKKSCDLGSEFISRLFSGQGRRHVLYLCRDFSVNPGRLSQRQRHWYPDEYYFRQVEEKNHYLTTQRPISITSEFGHLGIRGPCFAKVIHQTKRKATY